MAADLGYATLTARLTSFETSVVIPGKKKGSKSITWPHQNPSPAELARAGFFFKPLSSSHDNTQCFHCDHQLGGWEEEDDPVLEHVKHSPQCGWAIIMNAASDGINTESMEDPTQSRLADAREATFGLGWPHESKRGWLCKTGKMVQAGWHFAPTPESDDFVSCAYCKLSLDGWEPKDNPFVEHHRRSPDCPFFAFAGATAPKAGRGKKGRASKSSRLSTQSATTVASEAPSIPDLDESIDTSTLSVPSIVSAASKMGNKKNAKLRCKAARLKHDELIEAIDLELSEDIHKVPQTSPRALRGKKRTSDQINEDDRGERESTVKPEPPTKRRNTRPRNSVMKQPHELLQPEHEPMDIDQAPIKPAKGSRKRASSCVRKISVASTASLRALVPDNDEIDAALEAGLDKPLSEEEEEMKEEAKPKGRKRATTASKASARRIEQAEEKENASAAAESSMKIEVDTSQATNYDTEAEAQGPRRARSTKSKVPKKTTSKQSKRTQRTSNESTATAATNPGMQIENLTFDARTIEDDSGHETDASVVNKGLTQKGSKRKAAAKQRGKKTSGLMSKNIEDIVQSQPQCQGVAALTSASEPDLILPTAAEELMAVDSKSAEEHQVSKKSTKSTATRMKKRKLIDAPPQLSMPGAFSPLMPDATPEPSFTSVLSPTSPPVVLGTAIDHYAHVDTPPLPHRSPLRTGSARATPNPTPTPRKLPQQAQKTATPSPSPQSSDAENAPPSFKPTSTRPPLASFSPARHQAPVSAPGTPKALPISPSKIGGGLRSDAPWRDADVELIFAVTPGTEKENIDIFSGIEAGGLTSPEKKMSVQEWIYWNAQQAEERLRGEGERVVGVFEREGRRALMSLEGIEVVE